MVHIRFDVKMCFFWEYLERIAFIGKRFRAILLSKSLDAIEKGGVMLLFLHGGLVRRKLLLSGKVVYSQLADADSDRVFSLTVWPVF